MRALQPSGETEMVSTPPRRTRRRSGVGRPVAALALASAMVLGTSAVAANAADVDFPPGPTVVADPNSPTGYTGHFVYCNPDATSVRFVADIMLRNWADPADTKVYTPLEYKPGLMRGGGGYDVQMTDVGDDCWYTSVPLAAGANQYWFYVNNNTNAWLADPANSPLFAPDGIAFPSRRAFNKVFVPYDAAKQDFAASGRAPDRAPARGLGQGHVELRRAPGSASAGRHHPAHARRLPPAGLRPEPR